MEDEATSTARSRSRSPRLEASQPVAEAASAGDAGWAAKWRQAMSRKLGLGGREDSVAADDVAVDAPEGSEVLENAPAEDAEAATAMEPAEEAQPEEVVYEFRCLGCEMGFHESAQWHEHLRASAPCISSPLQAVVQQVACLPGAGSSLWCPACPDDYIGKWTGPATKAAALLRHLSAASTEGSPHEAAHRRFHAALAEMLIEDMPEDHGAASLREWAASAKLLQVAGPLLAQPSAPAREAVEKLQAEALGQDPSAASVPAGHHVERAMEEEEVEPDAEFEKSKLRILGLDLTVDDAEGSALYKDITSDTGHDTGVGCSLPSAGLRGLTSFDLTLSSDEETAPETKPKLSGDVKAAGVEAADDDDDENTFL